MPDTYVSNVPRRPWRPVLLPLFSLLMLAGCIKSEAVLRSNEAVPVAMAVVLSSVDDRGVQGAPKGVVQQVAAELERRNLVPVPVPPDAWSEPFSSARTTPHRVAFLAEWAGSAPLVLLVESSARFSSQINGRYRWTVDVEVTLGHPEADIPFASSTFTVPAALVYYHEREAEALDEAAPVVARQVGALLEGWIGARQAP